MSYTKPYEGIRVLDLTQGIAGPYCGGLLCEHGADVVKVEPPGGDWIRGIGGQYGDQTAHLVPYNLGKRSIVLDLKTPPGRDLVMKAASRADVMLESSRPGVAERLGIAYDAVKAVNSRIIYVSISGFGQDGPLAGRACTDTVMQAFSGLMSINSGPDGIPHRVGSTIVDAVTGLYAFLAVSTALYGRSNESQGRHIDVSLMQAAAALLSPKVIEWGMEGAQSQALNVPAGTYLTADGWIAIALVKEPQFRQLCEALDLAALADDPRFRTFATRSDNSRAITEVIRERLRERDSASWLERLEAQGILCERVHDFGHWLKHPQVNATAAAPKIVAPHIGAVPVPRTPGREGTKRPPPPRIGEHGTAILRELGLSPGDIEALVASRIVLLPEPYEASQA